MNRRRIAQGFGASRVFFGALLWARPDVGSRLWFGARAEEPGTALLQSIGARDVGLGLGLMASPDERTWLLAGVVADVGDTIATLATVRSSGRRTPHLFAATAAAGYAVAGAWLAATGGRSPAVTG